MNILFIILFLLFDTVHNITSLKVEPDIERCAARRTLNIFLIEICSKFVLHFCSNKFSQNSLISNLP